MKQLKYYQISNLVILLLICTACKIANANEKVSTNWQLTGREVLIELSDPKGELSPGIYAWDPAKSPDLTNLRLLVTGGHRPLWSPRYKRIAYLFNGDIWIADKEGSAASLSPEFSTRDILVENQVIQWSPDGRPYLTRTFPERGSVVLGTAPLESASINSLQESSHAPYHGFWSIRPFKKPVRENSNLAGQTLLNIQASGNASFSPDDQSLAVEIYPAGPLKMSRYQSHIQIYDMLPKAKNVKDFLDNVERLVNPWFYMDMSNPPVAGPGRHLLPQENNHYAEIMPLWSPDGNHIALTLVNTTNPAMIPMIVSPDGSSPIIINIPQFSGPGGVSWKPSTVPQPVQDRSQQQLFRQAIAWSDDGKYLWMRERANGLSVATKQEGKWMIRQVKWNDPSLFPEPLKVCFRGDKALWFQDSGDLRKILDVHVFDAETGKTQNYSLRSALKVLSVDW